MLIHDRADLLPHLAPAAIMKFEDLKHHLRDMVDIDHVTAEVTLGQHAMVTDERSTLRSTSTRATSTMYTAETIVTSASPSTTPENATRGQAAASDAAPVKLPVAPVASDTKNAPNEVVPVEAADPNAAGDPTQMTSF